MSTTTKTDFLDEDAPKDGAAMPVVTDPEQGQHDNGNGHHHDGNGHDHNGNGHSHGEDDDVPESNGRFGPDHVHTFVDGKLSPMCSGGGCVTKIPPA